MIMPSILLVEDHPIFAQALARVLRERGNLEITAIVDSAEQALDELYAAGCFPVLIGGDHGKTPRWA